MKEQIVGLIIPMPDIVLRAAVDSCSVILGRINKIDDEREATVRKSKEQYNNHTWGRPETQIGNRNHHLTNANILAIQSVVDQAH